MKQRWEVGGGSVRRIWAVTRHQSFECAFWIGCGNVRPCSQFSCDLLFYSRTNWQCYQFLWIRHSKRYILMVFNREIVALIFCWFLPLRTVNVRERACLCTHYCSWYLIHSHFLHECTQTARASTHTECVRERERSASQFGGESRQSSEDVTHFSYKYEYYTNGYVLGNHHWLDPFSVFQVEIFVVMMAE